MHHKTYRIFPWRCAQIRKKGFSKQTKVKMCVNRNCNKKLEFMNVNWNRNWWGCSYLGMCGLRTKSHWQCFLWHCFLIWLVTVNHKLSNEKGTTWSIQFEYVCVLSECVCAVENAIPKKCPKSLEAGRIVWLRMPTELCDATLNSFEHNRKPIVDSRNQISAIPMCAENSFV